VRRAAPSDELRAAAREIQLRLNPHPAGQATLNRPATHPHLKGVQHKYRETVLFFPSRGQTCFSYCTYCFRWPQFVGLEELKFAASEADGLAEYLRSHKEVSDVLVTGGDPLVMRAELLERYLEPLLADDLGHVTNLRIGTKALAFWPQRFLSDPDADRLLALFERIVKSRRHLAFMAHFSHPRELETASSPLKKSFDAQPARIAPARRREILAESTDSAPVPLLDPTQPDEFRARSTSSTDC
jgi:L-lysine 2,3-aminomutase